MVPGRAITPGTAGTTTETEASFQALAPSPM
jgi:hypothetical protein